MIEEERRSADSTQTTATRGSDERQTLRQRRRQNDVTHHTDDVTADVSRHLRRRHRLVAYN